MNELIARRGKTLPRIGAFPRHLLVRETHVASARPHTKPLK